MRAVSQIALVDNKLLMFIQILVGWNNLLRPLRRSQVIMEKIERAKLRRLQFQYALTNSISRLTGITHELKS
jgi:hypothetical protein